jgi:hypothetical protein
MVLWNITKEVAMLEIRKINETVRETDVYEVKVAPYVFGAIKCCSVHKVFRYHPHSPNSEEGVIKPSLDIQDLKDLVNKIAHLNGAVRKENSHVV